MVELRELSAGYGDKEVVHRVSLQLCDGEITVILGPNGSGKSTLVENIIGLNDRLGGELIIDEDNSSRLSLQEQACRVAYMAQIRPVPNIAVKNLVLHGRFPHLKSPRRYSRKDRELVDEALRAVNGLELKEQNMLQLSGGQRQRAYIAMALAQDTRNLFMDEPTNFLDIHYRLELGRLARQLAREGKMVCIVMHDLCMALSLADQLVVLEQGELRFCGKAEELRQSGILEEVFHVRIGAVRTASGLHYYYEDETGEG